MSATGVRIEITEEQAMRETVECFTEMSQMCDSMLSHFRYFYEVKCYCNRNNLMYISNCALCHYYRWQLGDDCKQCPLENCDSGGYYQNAQQAFHDSDYDMMRFYCKKLALKVERRLMGLDSDR